MARRIDVELTSARPDGSWTWRAAGAKQPKGVVDGALLYEGAQVGDVVRAEADFEMDGIVVTSVTPPPQLKRAAVQRIEVVGDPHAAAPGVTSSLVPKGRGGPRRDGERRDGERRDRPAGDRPPRREGAPAGRSDRPAGPRREGAGGRSERPAGDRPARTGDRPSGDRGSGARGARPDGAGARPGRPARDERPAPAKPKRLTPKSVHRDAVLADLPPEERPVAEQVLRGGLPAVRQAVEQQNTQARSEGKPEVPGAQLLAVAERLLHRLKSADWRDRAEAAAAELDQVALRDLRSVVAGADAAARDDETRELARTLREALEQRVAKQRDDWVSEVTRSLEEGRLVRALRVASRPPDPGSRFPAELATTLASAASEAMAPDAPPDRWLSLIEAVAASPVRRSVKPVGLPAEPGEPLLQAARQASGRIPALATLLGIDMPPPPGPRKPVPPRPPRPPAPKPAPAASTEAPPASAAEPPPPTDVAPRDALATPPPDGAAATDSTPAAGAPATDAPTTDAPAADSPPAATDAPASDAPAAVPPPAAEAPATDAPPTAD